MTLTTSLPTSTVANQEASAPQPIAKIALVTLLAGLGSYFGTKLAVVGRVPEFGAAVLFPSYTIHRDPSARSTPALVDLPARLRRGPRGGDGLLSVADADTGIPEDEMDRVFEPFVTSKQGGLGLGLAICRSIVKAHRGRLWAVNNPSGGATFHLALPLGTGSGPIR